MPAKGASTAPETEEDPSPLNEEMVKAMMHGAIEPIADMLGSLAQQIQQMQSQSKDTFPQQARFSTPTPPLPQPTFGDDAKDPFLRTLGGRTEKRLQGAKDRVKSRLESLNRVYAETGELDPVEEARLRDMLQAHADAKEVRFSTRNTHLEIEQQRQRTRAMPMQWSRWAAEGATPLDDEATITNTLAGLIKSKVSTSSSSTMKVSTFADFCALFRKMKVLTPLQLRQEPEVYWNWTWHYQCVEYIMHEYSWTIAQAYHYKIFDLWREGEMDFASYVEKPAFQRGDMMGALHWPVLNRAIHGKPMSSGKDTTKGTKTRLYPTDTKCDHHNQYFRVEADHEWDKKAETGTCGVAKSRLKNKRH
jgi:hypothetical protein